MKGTEEFWLHTAEPMNALVADHLSDTLILSRFWTNRHRQRASIRHHAAA